MNECGPSNALHHKTLVLHVPCIKQKAQIVLIDSRPVDYHMLPCLMQISALWSRNMHNHDLSV